MTLSNVDIYTDGSALRNPGMGGYAYIIRYTEDSSEQSMPVFKEIEQNQGYRYTTNNRMEIMGALFGIRHFIDRVNDGTIKGCSQLNIYSDSEYLCNPINNRWLNKWIANNWMTAGYKTNPPQPVKNKDLWEQIVELQDAIHNMGIQLVFTHVKGHNGNEFNERADKLAVAASSGTNHLIDEMFENSMGIPKSK